MKDSRIECQISRGIRAEAQILKFLVKLSMPPAKYRFYHSTLIISGSIVVASPRLAHASPCPPPTASSLLRSPFLYPPRSRQGLPRLFWIFSSEPGLRRGREAGGIGHPESGGSGCIGSCSAGERRVAFLLSCDLEGICESGMDCGGGAVDSSGECGGFCRVWVL